MKYHLVLTIWLALMSVFGMEAQTISGFVLDDENGEVIIGALVLDTAAHVQLQSNEHGKFSYHTNDTLPHKVLFHFLGYRDTLLELSPSSAPYSVRMRQSTGLQEVVISASPTKAEDLRMSTIQIPIATILKMPVLFGEADALRAFQYMPGVQFGKEGTSGIYVRGGGPDQNLFLLDDVPLYSVNHIGGFLSTFDAEAINSIELYKGAFPARYGGRLSAVLDVRMRNGNASKTIRKLNLGTLASKFSIQGPLGKTRSTYFLSVRRCNLDLFTRPIALLNSKGNTQTGYTFFDLYGKWHWHVSATDQLSFSFYAGQDRLFLKSNDEASDASGKDTRFNTNVRWGNQLAALKWTHETKTGNSWVSSLSTTHFFYDNSTIAEQSAHGEDQFSKVSSIAFLSGITDFTLKTEYFLKQKGKHQMKAGAGVTWHRFNPGSSRYESTFVQQNNNALVANNTVNALETWAYMSDVIKMGKFKFEPGLHAVNYRVKEKNYASIQPRAVLSYSADNHHTWNTGFASTRQFAHLLSNNGAGLPTDLWVPSNDSIAPSHAWQYTLGYVYLFGKKRQYECSAEAFYKRMSHLIDYTSGVSIINSNKDWTQIVAKDGRGEAYGAEFLLRKNYGRTHGWIGYCLSKNTRQFASLNEGKSFPYKYDRRHDISIVVVHELNEQITISATWMYATGTAITLADGRYNILTQDHSFDMQTATYPAQYFQSAEYYSGRNNYRLPAFHKMDLSITFRKQKSFGERNWNISIYNAYMHQNAFFVFYKNDSNGQRKLYQVSLFPIIPSVSYSLTF